MNHIIETHIDCRTCKFVSEVIDRETGTVLHKTHDANREVSRAKALAWVKERQAQMVTGE